MKPLVGWHRRLPPLHLVRAFVAARLATINAVVLSVFREPAAIVGLAQGAITWAVTVLFRLVADDAATFYMGHRFIISRGGIGDRNRLVVSLSASPSAKSTP